MKNEYVITYQLEEGLVKKTVTQAKTNREAYEMAKKIINGRVLHIQEENYYIS
ncbi:hypothetical protein KFZ58_14650 [Virgibacillus sp. NKC19-16]|uniref:hypothetical protein n=1 Tax=Virgibacillus salidurans TaxID=2831673 RepID=UPI001F3E7F5B|nr:hypothetical protein [Virgibacillus sp. NKC19-16]UJL45622.1 hypothetical protein KFZ58_14650 [Virgibacillus sp. NKC19-16]